MIGSLSVAGSVGTSSCGVSKQVAGFIVNGTLSGEGKWPWIASIHDAKKDKFMCSGVLVAQNMVVTVSVYFLCTALARKNEGIHQMRKI